MEARSRTRRPRRIAEPETARELRTTLEQDVEEVFHLKSISADAEKAYDKAVEGVLETQGKIMRHRADTMSAALEQLSAEDRKKFARDILAGLSPGRKGGHHHKGKWDKPKPVEEQPKN